MKKPSVLGVLWEMGKILFAKPIPPPPGLEDMVRRRIGAMQIGDSDAYQSTNHPASLARIDDQNREMFDDVFKKELATKLPADFKISVILLDPKQELFMDEYLDYAVRPTHVVKVSYKQPPNNYSMLCWAVAEQDGKWYVVIAPPDLKVPGMKEAIAEKRGTAVADSKKLEDLYFRTDPGVLTGLREMLRKNQKITAIQQCQSKMGLSLVEAKDFVELVEKNS